ncbi:MAG: lysophospholipid acyltransferase family protein [Nitrospirae bacterium]|nr:lysophospholipid acyltransferase family protein [Nitrospirota bacterium]
MGRRRRRNKRGLLARLTYAGALLLYLILNGMPHRVALNIGEWGGWLLYGLDRRHRRLVQEQLRMAFPDWPASQVTRTARQCYLNFGRSAAEFARLGRADRDTILGWVTMEGREHLDRALAGGRGVLFVTAHLGNWELLAVVCNLLGYRLFPVARPLDNPWLNRLIDRIRSRHGSRIISKKADSAPRDLMRALRAGDCVGILLDQNMAPYDGVFVNFFGRPACTTKGLALIARRTGAPVLPAFIAREADGRHRVIVLPPVQLSRTNDVQRDIVTNTSRCTAVIEQMVRRYPDQWLWMHRRWKTQPPPVPPSVSSSSPSASNDLSVDGLPGRASEGRQTPELQISRDVS